MDQSSGQLLVAETLARMDAGWSAFQGRLRSIPSQLLELAVAPGGWTRKQMLAHIAAWHELTVARLTRLVESGQPQEAPSDELTNARAGRAAVGRTTGEIVLDLDLSYRQLRRKVAALTDSDLAAHDDWAAAVIAGNTYGHYEEHLADLAP